MTSIVYKSIDTDAPILYGAADSVNALLKACLVDGYTNRAAAGWTSPYYDSATKTRVFLTGGSGIARYLRVLDNGQSTGGTREARCICYESMSAHDTGTALVPTNAQRSVGIGIRKSTTADGTTARVWYLFANENSFHLFTESGDATNSCHYFGFGKFKSDKVNDDYACWIGGRQTENSGSFSSSNDPALYRYTFGGLGFYFSYAMRSYSGTGSAITVTLFGDTEKISSASVVGSSGAVYPAKADGGLHIARTTVWEVIENCQRGSIPGFWTPSHNRPLAHLDTVSGSGGISSKTFLALSVASTGQVLMETSDTWDV